MFKKWSVCLAFVFILFIASACSSPFMDRGMEEKESITAEDIPEEPEKDEIISKINANTSNEIDDIIRANFSLMDVVTDEKNNAQIYATQQLEHTELASVLSAKIEPEEISEEKNNQQILIYPDYFVTLKVNEDDENVILIEVASEEFVRRNYAPSFLSTYFTYRLLDNFLGNGWSNRRAGECQSGNCYGGYTSTLGTPGRGNTTFRGGGPGSGK